MITIALVAPLLGYTAWAADKAEDTQILSIYYEANP